MMLDLQKLPKVVSEALLNSKELTENKYQVLQMSA